MGSVLVRVRLERLQEEGLELRIDRRGGACSEACSSPSRPDATCRLIVKGLCGQSRSTQSVAAFQEPKERCTGGFGRGESTGSLPYAIGRFTEVRPPLRDDWSKLTDFFVTSFVTLVEVIRGRYLALHTARDVGRLTMRGVFPFLV